LCCAVGRQSGVVALGDLVIELAASPEVALVQRRSVQTGLAPNISSRRTNAAGRTLIHIAHVQVFNTHHCLVLPVVALCR